MPLQGPDCRCTSLKQSDNAAVPWDEPALLAEQSSRWLRRPLQGQGPRSLQESASRRPLQYAPCFVPPEGLQRSSWRCNVVTAQCQRYLE